MIKSFKGQIADGGQETIRLGTIRGEIGYRIKKYAIIPSDPANTSNESIVKVFTVEPAAVSETVNFNDPTLLAVAFYSGNTAASAPQDMVVIFDNTVFTQVIHLTHATDAGSAPINYYLELEQVKLSLNEATVATLKDMRGTN